MELKVMLDHTVLSNWKVDLCNNDKSNRKNYDLIKLATAYFGVPSTCPITAPKVHCSPGPKIGKFSESIRKLLKMFVSRSKKTIVMQITHDSGVSCFEAINQVVKKT